MAAQKTYRIRLALPAAVVWLSFMSLACRIDLSFEKRDGGADAADVPEGEDIQIPDNDIVEMDQAEGEPLPSCGNGTTDEGEECDDGNDIPGDGCEPGTCIYTCHNDAECSDDNICNGAETCDTSSTHTCRPGADAEEGTPCEDDYDCTTGEYCDGAGNCLASYNDELCPPGEICRPACFDNPSGCGPPPGSLILDCGSPVYPPSASTCTITLETLQGQTPCLHCEAAIGPVVLRSDFGDDSGSCDEDGWSLVSGNECAPGYDTGDCSAAGPPVECCSDFSTVCTQLDGNYVLKSDMATNCGGGIEEWRITKTFDTTGLDNIALTFGMGARTATADDFFLVRLSDASHSEFLVCSDGSILASLPYRGRDKLYLFHFDLPAWTGNNPNLEVAFIANSSGPDHTMYIDDISLRGWPAACPRAYNTAFEETFSGCPDPIPDGWNGWTVTGSPICPGFECSGGEGDAFGAESNGSGWTMEHAVDTSELGGDVHLCFDLGESGAGNGESVTVEFSTDGGMGWQTAWEQDGDMTVDGRCARICVDLSGMDISVRKNAGVRIRFTVESNNRPVDIDDIVVRGAVYCNAGTDLVVGAAEETPSPGRYELLVENADGGQLSALVTCTWDGPETDVGGVDEILFRPSP